MTMVAMGFGSGCVAGADDDAAPELDGPSDPDDGGTAPSTDDSDGGSAMIDDEVCMAAQDAQPAHFAFDVGEWALDEDAVQWTLIGACTVDAVTIADDAISTALTCMDGAAGPYAVTLDVADASGDPSWAAGDSVDMQAEVADNGGGLVDDPQGGIGRSFLWSEVSLRRASDGALLVAGASGPGSLSIFEPLLYDEIGPCAPVEPCSADEAAPLQVSVAEAAGESIVFVGGQHAELPLGDGTTLVIDAPRLHATGDCHFGSDFSVVARRMD